MPILPYILDLETSSGDTIYPDSILSAESFGSPKINLTVYPTSISSAESFGSHAIKLTVLPNSITSAESFGSPKINSTIYPNSITSTESFGSPEVQVDVSVLPNSITSAESFGSPKINVTIYPNSVSSAESFGSPTVSNGTSVLPDSITSAESFGSPKINVTIYPSSITSAESFGSPEVQVDVSVLPSSIVSEEAFGSPKINVTIYPSSITSAESFGSPEVQVDVSVLPSSIVSEEAFGSPGVSTATGIFPDSIVSEEAFGSPQVIYDVSVLPSSIASAEAFGSPQVIYDVIINPESIGTAEEVGMPFIVTDTEEVINKIKFHLSGGESNTNPSDSLGGEMSDGLVANSLNNLFSGKAKKGTEYKCFYIINNNDFPINNFKIYLEQNTSIVSIGLPLINEVQQIILRGEPTGGSFVLRYLRDIGNVTYSQDTDSIPFTNDGVDMARHIQDALNSLAYLSNISVTATEAEAEWIYTITFAGKDGGRNQHLLSIENNEIIGYNIEMEVVSITNGYPINAQANNTEFANQAPSNITFNTNMIEIDELESYERFPVWLKRKISDNLKGTGSAKVKISMDI